MTMSLIALMGCQMGRAPSEPTPQVSEETQAKLVETITKALVDLTPTPTPTPMAVGNALKRLAFDLATPENNFIFIRSDPTDWPDTSLGCSEPDYMYAQVITPGYTVVFEFEGNAYIVHTDKDGTNTARCLSDALLP